MFNRFIFLFIATFVFLSSARAQNDTDLNHGPRAGKVLGTTAPHAEVVKGADDNLKVYFIDKSWVDVSTENVLVTALLITNKKPSGFQVSCKLETIYFKCEIPKVTLPERAETLKITRSQKEGPPITYDYKF
jgi:hypothetical protein